MTKIWHIVLVLGILVLYLFFLSSSLEDDCHLSGSPLDDCHTPADTILAIGIVIIGIFIISPTVHLYNLSKRFLKSCRKIK